MEDMKDREIVSLAGAEPRALADEIAKILEDKKANDVKVLTVADKTIIADYFVVANGNTNTHVRSLADEVEYKLRIAGVEPARVEAGATSWRVLDYCSVIVHVFDREAREFYKLDKLYTDFE